MIEKQSYVYILTNKNKTVLYIGITSDIIKRIYQHKSFICEGFTRQYKCIYLVYYEVFEDIQEAIKREKQLKKYKREWKIDLIEKQNKSWEDLYNNLIN